MAKSWKDALLRSGVPLEGDVKRYLDRRECMSRFEFSYLKPDENKIERQFSYDIDSSYIRPPHFVNFLIECKYRHESVQWVFLPDEYGGPDEHDANVVVHPCDHFVSLKFPFRGQFPRRLASCCSKGVEITNEGPNEKSISQALAQIAFGFAPQVADACEHQVLRLLGSSEWIFYHIPIIVTTASLFRLMPEVSVHAIRDASNLEDIATKHHTLVQTYHAGVELTDYNRRTFEQMRAKLNDKILARSINSFTKDLDHLFAVIAAHYCPAAVLVISVADGWVGFDELFTYVDDLIAPSDALKAELASQQKAMEAQHDAFSAAVKKATAKVKARRRRTKGTED